MFLFFLQWWKQSLAMLMGSSANFLSCSWAPSTTAAQLRVVMTVSYGVPPLTTLMKMPNTASALMNVSFPGNFLFFFLNYIPLYVFSVQRVAHFAVETCRDLWLCGPTWPQKEWCALLGSYWADKTFSQCFSTGKVILHIRSWLYSKLFCWFWTWRK